MTDVKNLFNKNSISASCSYCTHGRLSPNGETVLCMKLGVVEKDFSCKKFKYDPLKRQPRRPRELEHFEAEDFSLDIETEE